MLYNILLSEMYVCVKGKNYETNSIKTKTDFQWNRAIDQSTAIQPDYLFRCSGASISDRAVSLSGH